MTKRIILKLFGSALLVLLLILTFVYGRDFSRQIEERSIRDAAQNYYEKKLINEIRWGMHSLMNPLLDIQYPAIKIVEVRRNMVCPKKADENKEGYVVEAILLSYWGIPTPLHIHYMCSTIIWGRFSRREQQKFMLG